jgi:hypothetical protein
MQLIEILLQRWKNEVAILLMIEYPIIQPNIKDIISYLSYFNHFYAIYFATSTLQENHVFRTKINNIYWRPGPSVS